MPSSNAFKAVPPRLRILVIEVDDEWAVVRTLEGKPTTPEVFDRRHTHILSVPHEVYIPESSIGAYIDLKVKEAQELADKLNS